MKGPFEIGSHYKVDWKKVKTVGDLKRILREFDIRFTVDHPSLDKVIHLLEYVEVKNDSDKGTDTETN